MRYHSCNENTFKDKPVGSILFAGRNWLTIKKRTFHSEWYLLHKATSNLACKIEWGSGDGNDGIMLHIAIPKLFSFYVSIDRIFGRIFYHPNEPRETGFSFHHGAFYFYPFSKVNSWTRNDNWFSKYHSLDIVDFICGRNRYTEEDVTPWSDIVVAMPEGNYKGKIKLYTGTWKNRFRTLRIRRAEIEMEEGIPFPGKGENSWDCGEDCTWGMTCPANTEYEAIASLIQSVLRNRRVYGSRSCMNSYTPTRKYIRNEMDKQKSSEADASEPCQSA